MKPIKTLLCALLAAATLPAWAETLTPLRAQDVRDSIGINTHINYTDGSYRAPDEVYKALDYLGIKLIRDSSPFPWVGGSTGVNTYTNLMKKGVKFNIVLFGQGPGANYDPKIPVDLIDNLEWAYPGGIVAIEGFNEIDHAPVTYGDQRTEASSIAAHLETVRLLRERKRLKSLPIYDLTGTAAPQALGPRGDYANKHVYAQNGNPPRPHFEGAHKGLNGLKPWVVTEFGYATYPEIDWLVIGVDERTQAKGTLMGIFDAYHLGASSIYLYELLDQKLEPHREMHFGLFDYHYKPKPAETAVRNLIRIIEDKGAGAKAFTPRALEVDVNLPEGTFALALDKADGVTQLVIWRETQIWVREAGKRKDNPTVPLAVKLPDGAKARALYDPLIGEAPVKTYGGEGQVTIDLPDYPVILEFTR
ncbi:hypothetical protein [Asticcacaulis endophyticus]|uniref:Uncharacterized protein n=1 Tax=Asticcacaulis endophyticus TaxID=1395890 RepID=A0A918UMQ7_9CAUL|nr:hypothetical protein [Asticcacaulis endophyticus]GGZ22892.1 hypothetical protein GCM10011273_04710 [Asticcacaulis endophyticus]